VCNPCGAHLCSCPICWSYNHSSCGQVVATRVILVAVIESGQGRERGGSITVVSPHCHRCHPCCGRAGAGGGHADGGAGAGVIIVRVLNAHRICPHNVPTLSRLTWPPEGENRPSVTGQRTGAQG